TRERIELNGHGESYNPSLDRGRARPRSNGHSAARIAAPGREDTSEAFDFESQDEAQFLRPEKRGPGHRGTLARKAASRVHATTIPGLAVASLGCVAVAASAYGIHAARFRIESSDSIKISGVHNASRVQVMEVAGADIGRNIFFVPLDERRKQLEQI